MSLTEQQTAPSQTPVIMAILNVTPDSFSDGGQLPSEKALLNAAQTALEAGATVLDVGGESTRPGAQCLSEETERSRVIPAIRLLASHFPQAQISIDTRKASVAKAALAEGASIVNDVSGLQYDPAMADVVANAQAKLVLMHSQGTPETMQQNPQYDNVVSEVLAFLQQQSQWAEGKGIEKSRIIWDPGIGFGKTLDHNLVLMAHLQAFTSHGYPVLLGTSRKSFLCLGQTCIPTDEREALTATSMAWAYSQGIQWFRVHDVATQAPALKLIQTIINAKAY